MNKHTASTPISSKKAPMAADTIADSVQTLVDQGVETIDTIKARVSEVTDEARSKGAELLERTTQLVKQHPLTSLIVSFGAGYIAMRITTSRITQLAMIGGLIYGGGRLMKS